MGTIYKLKAKVPDPQDCMETPTEMGGVTAGLQQGILHPSSVLLSGTPMALEPLRTSAGYSLKA